jgi:hypothetical protein
MHQPLSSSPLEDSRCAKPGFLPSAFLVITTCWSAGGAGRCSRPSGSAAAVASPAGASRKRWYSRDFLSQRQTPLVYGSTTESSTAQARNRVSHDSARSVVSPFTSRSEKIRQPLSCFEVGSIFVTQVGQRLPRSTSTPIPTSGASRFLPVVSIATTWRGWNGTGSP